MPEFSEIDAWIELFFILIGFILTITGITGYVLRHVLWERIQTVKALGKDRKCVRR